jgi:hypothetical protein
MSGQDLAERLQVKNPALKTLFTSGYPPDSIVSDGETTPGVMLIQKPFTIGELGKKVRQALQR